MTSASDFNKTWGANGTAGGGTGTQPFQPAPYLPTYEQTRKIADGYAQGGDPFWIPEDWDYKTAKLGPDNEELPEGAIGWTPEGTPYFGNTFAGWINEFKWNLTQKPTELPTKKDYQSTSDAAATFINSFFSGDFSKENLKLGLSTFWGGITLPIKSAATTLFGTTGEEPSPVINLIPALVTTLGKAANEVADKAEQVLFGLTEAARSITEETGEPTYAEATGDVEGSEAQIKALEERGTFWGWFDKAAITGIAKLDLPANVYYFGKAIPALIRDPSLWNIVERDFAAARIAYSYFAEPAIQEEYISRYTQGREDPYLLARELEKPGVELAFELIIDPLNLIGPVLKGMKETRMLGKINKAMTQVVPGIADGLKIGEKLDEISAAEKILDNAGLVRGAVTDIRQGIGKLARSDTILGKTVTSKRALFGNRTGAMYMAIGQIVKAENPVSWVDDMAEITRAFGLIGSSDEAKIIEGLTILQKQKIPLNWALSEVGLELSVMSDWLYNSKDAEKLFDTMKTAETIEDLVKGVTPALDDIIKKMYPDIAERAKIGAISNPIQSRIIGYADSIKRAQQPVNNFFANAYMGFNPGYLARNLINNTLTAFVDQGLGVFWQGGKYMTSKNWREWFKATLDYIPGRAEAGFGAAGAIEGAEAYKGLKKFNMLTHSQQAERGMSLKVFGYGTKRALDKLGMRVFNTLEDLAASGIPREVAANFPSMWKVAGGKKDEFLRLVGDVVGTGDVVDVYRSLGWLPQGFVDDLGSLPGTWDNEVMKALHLDTREAVQARLGEIRDDILKLGDNAAGDLIPEGFDEAAEAAIFRQLQEDGWETIDSSMIELSTSAKNANIAVEEALLKQAKTYESHVIETLGQQAWDDFIEANPQFAGLFNGEAISDIYNNAPSYALFDDFNRFVGKGADQNWAGLWKKFGVPLDFPAEAFSKLSPLKQRQLFGDLYWNAYARPKIRAYWMFARDETISRMLGETGAVTQLGDALRVQFPDMIFMRPAQVDEITGLIDEALKWDTAIFEQVGNNRFVSVAPEVRDNFESLVQLARSNGIPTASKYGKPTKQLLNTINKNLPEGIEPFKFLDEVPYEVGEQALRQALGDDFVDLGLKVSPIPEGAAARTPLYPIFGDVGAAPSAAQSFYQMRPKYQSLFDDLSRLVDSNWGKKQRIVSDPQMRLAIEEAARIAEKRWTDAKLIAPRFGEAMRDFALLDYTDRRNLDTLLGIVFPYQFWHTRTYVNWMKRIASDPQVISGYLKYKDTLAQLHAGMPEWWKYNVNTNELLGLDSENPLYFNLEATLNPLYQWLGVDFDDPYRRKSSYARMIDNLSRLGPSVWTPLTWIAAIQMVSQGEKEAAQHWAGSYMFPISRAGAAAGALLDESLGEENLISKAFDIFNYDPGILFSGGSDPWEDRRTNRALAAMVNEGLLTKEEAYDVSYYRTGEWWEKAQRRARVERAPGQLFSFLMGTGFKTRSKSDIEIDQFYNEWFRFWNMRDSMTPEEYRQGMDGMREKYPWMDALLLGTKDSNARDTTYTYGVLSRIPPSGSEIAELAGIDYDLRKRFYDDKGFDNFTEPERMRFMAGIVDMAAMLAIPDNATQQEWAQAKLGYNQVRQQISSLYGNQIWDKIDLFWEYYQENPDKAYDYRDKNPDADAAMVLKDSLIAANPDSALFAYYGGLDVLERYYMGQARKQIEIKLGVSMSTIWELQDEYYALPENERKAFKTQNPILVKYWELNRTWTQWADQKIASLGDKIAKAEGVVFRPNFEPTTAFQEQFVEGLTTAEMKLRDYTVEDWQDTLGEDGFAAASAYIAEGRELDYNTRRLLEEIAESLGLDFSRLMQIFGMALMQQ